MHLSYYSYVYFDNISSVQEEVRQVCLRRKRLSGAANVCRQNMKTSCEYTLLANEICILYFIMLTCPRNEDPLTPHFYIVKLGFK